MSQAKKLVMVPVTFLLVNETSKKNDLVLERISYIYYLLYFWKNTANIKALIDSGGEVNVITPAYATKLGLKAYHTNVEA